MFVLAFALSAVLIAITSLHVYWGIGGIWPGTDAASCARTVVGAKGVQEMPAPFACFAVAACLVLVTLWPLALMGIFATPFPQGGLAGAAVLIAMVFIGRGLIAFTPWWRSLTPEQPFARLDRLYYSPLCLLIGAGFAILGVSQFPA